MTSQYAKFENVMQNESPIVGKKKKKKVKG